MANQKQPKINYTVVLYDINEDDAFNNRYVIFDLDNQEIIDDCNGWKYKDESTAWKAAYNKFGPPLKKKTEIKK